MFCNPQVVQELLEDLGNGCRTLVRNETAMALLRDPPAQLLIGDSANECGWIMSDLLRCSVDINQP